MIRILIIDDEPRWLKFANSDLDDFDLVIAKSAKEAVARLDENRFDLVIASARYMDVLEVISKKYSDKRFIVTTIQPSPDEASKVFHLGAMRYLPKSFKPNGLSKQVKEVIPPHQK